MYMLLRFLKLLSTAVALSGLLACGMPLAEKNDQLVLIEAESVNQEVGGRVIKRSDRPSTSAGQCISNWDDKDHSLEWRVTIAQSGKYQIIMRYSTARKWNVYRNLMINGEFPDPALEKIIWKSTGGWGVKPEEWRNLLLVDATNKPISIYLERGEHVLKANNLGGAGRVNGSANLDVIALVAEGADTAKILTTLGQVKAKAQSQIATPPISFSLPIPSPILKHPPASLAQVGFLERWKLVLPSNAESGGPWADEILPAKLKTFTSPPWFYASTNGVVFRAHAGGIKSSNNTRYARTELREMRMQGNGDQMQYSNAAWDVADMVERRMFIRQTITAVPLKKPQVIIGQMHNATDDVVIVKFEGDTPGLRNNKGKLLVKINGSRQTYVLDHAYIVGTPFSVEIIAKAGKISVLYNNAPTQVRNVAVTIQTPNCYWMAGMYIQSSHRNATGYNNGFRDENSNEYGEVIIHELRIQS